jgi:hypothetical protein
MIKYIGMFFLLQSSVQADVICHFRGRLGNQLFQTAAALALSKEQGCSIYFPDFEKLEEPTEDYGLNQLKYNYHHIFHRLPRIREKITPSYIYSEPDLAFHPIPYQPHTEIVGYFLSENFFRNYREEIIDLFSPSNEVEEYLNGRFHDIITHSKTVAIHVRTGYLEYSLNDFNPHVYDNYLPPDKDFIRQGIELFEEDALFVVFSDHIGWCKENFSDIPRQFVFIEENDYIYDFYLLSKCKHAIIANSSFSWWGAYLNRNPNKKIVCRMPFWGYGEESNRDILCEDWIAIPMTKAPPIPQF